jgi:uncharacterized protein (TIGR00299 family) protein
LKALCFDPVGGVAGDMILGALLDLGADIDDVDRALRSTGLDGFRLSFSREPDEQGIAYGRLEVTTEETHHHRRLGEIEDIINRGDFPPRARDRAIAVFRRLGKAEADIHQIPIDEVEFHEVGAIDAIIDIVGSMIALELLNVEAVFCSPIPIGRGTIAASHGVLPVPAPATAELLKGHEVIRLPVNQELTTPTGAAIITTLSQGDWSGRPMVVEKIGTGRGTKTIKGVPNILRAFLVEMESESESQWVDVLETDIDDDTPEITSHLMQVLREGGALDVSLTPVLMKKGRAGFRLTVLGQRGDAPLLSKILFSNSSTIGVRATTARRLVLPRSSVTISTRWGDVTAKKVVRPNRTEIVPEFEECRRIAEQEKLSIREVMQEVIRRAESQ